MKYIVTKYVSTEPKYEVIKTTYENSEGIEFEDFNRMVWNMVYESEYYKGFATYYCNIVPEESVEVMDNGNLLKFITTYSLEPDEDESEEPDYDDIN